MDEITKHLLVSIPHSGVLCPKEIILGSLSEHQQALALDNVDWYTDHLYDFRDLLNNKQLVFPFNQIFINVNRHPEYVDEVVPLSINGLDIYREGQTPTLEFRTKLISKYHHAYHQNLQEIEKLFILDAHSTVHGLTDATESVVEDDIIISDRQESALDPVGGIQTAPEGFLETYGEELERRMAGMKIKISLNSTYTSTYGHVMATHGWNGSGIAKHQVPVLLQETTEELYTSNGQIDVFKLEELRRIFSEALSSMMHRMFK